MFVLFIIIINIVVFAYVFLFYKFKCLEDDFEDLYDTVYKQLKIDFDINEGDF